MIIPSSVVVVRMAAGSGQERRRHPLLRSDEPSGAADRWAGGLSGSHQRARAQDSATGGLAGGRRRKRSTDPVRRPERRDVLGQLDDLIARRVSRTSPGAVEPIPRRPLVAAEQVGGGPAEGEGASCSQSALRPGAAASCWICGQRRGGIPRAPSAVEDRLDAVEPSRRAGPASLSATGRWRVHRPPARLADSSATISALCWRSRARRSSGQGLRAPTAGACRPRAGP